MAWLGFEILKKIAQKTLPNEVEHSCVDPTKPDEAYPEDIDDLKSLLEAQVKYTQSEVASQSLLDWPKLATSVFLFHTDFKKAIVAEKNTGNNISSKIQVRVNGIIGWT